MKNIYFLLLFLILRTSITFSQSDNDFKIGIIAGEAMSNNNGGYLVQKTLDGTSEYTSVLGVLEEDGVNLIRDYQIGVTTKQQFKDWIQLINLHNMQMMTSFNDHAFRLSTVPNSNINIWENLDANNWNSWGLNQCHGDQGDGYSLNYNSLFDEVYNVSPYKETIWGHVMAAEYGPAAKYIYYKNDSIPCQPTGNSYLRPPRWNVDFLSKQYWKDELMPFTIAQEQFTYFNTKKGLTQNNNQLLINAPGMHNEKIEGTIQAGFITMTNHGDICYDAGYIGHFWKDMNQKDFWKATKHYCKFENIDFEKKYFNDVYAEIDCARKLQDNGVVACDAAHKFSTMKNFQNFDLIWFQTYNSIIHGVKGIVFYYLNEMFAEENDEMPYFEDDKIRRENFFNIGLSSRFNRDNFPNYYTRFLSHLFRELSYLNKKGFLNKNPKTIIATKTNHADPLGVVPPFSEYSRVSFQSYNSRGMFNECNTNVEPDFYFGTNENFGLRYTIRTNGNEVIMIITNPTPFLYDNIPLNFNKLSHSAITNATCVEVLFEKKDKSIYDNYYKADRESMTIEDLQAGELNTFYKIPIIDGKISIDFGAFDVHVLRFKREYPEINFNNEWFNIWSNDGNNTLGGWWMREFDKFFPGDFDGDGDEELLCVQFNPASDKCWVLLTEHKNDEWKWVWSNVGSGNINNWTIRSTDNFIIGDFNNLGRDQLLIIQKQNENAEAGIFKFENGSWDRIYTNPVLGYIGEWDISTTDKFIAAHFDTYQSDQLLALQALPNTNQNKIRLQKLNYDTWSSIFSATGMLGSWTINSNDTYVWGNFDGDSKDEIICHNIPDHINSKMYKFDGRIWVEKWNENINPDITPYKSDFIIGDFNGDKIDEVLGNGKAGNGWMTLFRFDNNLKKFVWSWTSGHGDYLDDLYIKSLRANTNFLPIKSDSRIGERILAIREYSGENHLASYYAYAPDNNSVNSSLFPGSYKDHYFYIPMTSKVTFTTCAAETNFDTQMSVFNENGTYIGSNDNDPSCTICVPAYKASTIGTVLVKGIYRVRISGRSGSSYGNYKLSAKIENIYTIPFNVSGNTKSRPDEWDVQGVDNSDKAYCVYINSADNFDVTTDWPFTKFNTMFEIFIDKYHSTGLYNDDISTDNGNSALSGILTPGYYYFVVDGKNDNAGNFMLDVSFPENFKAELITEKVEKFSDVILYPNPTNNQFYIKSDKEIKKVDIFSITGALLFSINYPSGSYSYSVNCYPKGLYIVKVYFQGEIKSLKLIIK
ncbi:MAG TPA: T9SS type A sorting domain-containing protein [Lentimicrobium sp.]|nr:T9SS type A sorting domain-containing protein [Lentimicrobium sp.]